MQINLANTRLFRGMEPSDIEEMLDCLHAKEHAFQKGEIIFPEGTATEQIGVVLSGRVIIEMGDVWGNNSVLSSIGPGGVFAEAYACVPGEPLMVNVTAAEDTQALLLNIRRVLEPCANVCPRHVRLVQNLLTLCSEKNLQLSRRVLHTGPKSIHKISVCVPQFFQQDLPRQNDLWIFHQDFQKSIFQWGECKWLS